MFRGCLSVAGGLATLAALLAPAPAAAQWSYRYPYNYGFNRGHYPYYYSNLYPSYFPNAYYYYYPPPETSVHYQPRYQAVYYPGLGYSLRYQDTGAAGTIWSAYQGVTPTGPNASTKTPDNTVTIDVRVPDPDAVVWIDGHQTAQRGTARQFVSPPLTPGSAYRYEIRAEWTQGGRKVEQKQTVNVEAGQRLAVDFFSGTPVK
jgi:uncharacterized protein (TIGR03000 family)